MEIVDLSEVLHVDEDNVEIGGAEDEINVPVEPEEGLFMVGCGCSCGGQRADNHW